MRTLINRFRVFILPIVTILLILIRFFSVASAQLPPEIVADKHLIHAEQLHAAKDYAAAFEVMQKIIALQEKHNLTVPDDFHFKYARVALSADSNRIALESVSRYLSATGKEGQFYQEALKLMLRAEGNEVISAEDLPMVKIRVHVDTDEVKEEEKVHTFDKVHRWCAKDGILFIYGKGGVCFAIFKRWNLVRVISDSD